MGVTTLTVAFDGVDARPVEVQCAATLGIPSFSIVGLPDKAVSEARERVKAALSALQIALPSKRIVVNLSPADLPKEGSHFDLPIALAVLATIGMLDPVEIEPIMSLGELSLQGGLTAVAGVLPAAVAAGAEDRTLICPQACGAEAAWVDSARVFAPASLGDLIAHLTGQKPLEIARPRKISDQRTMPCLSEVRGQERAKRALEIAAAGRHHLMMIGPPGAGKSMLAARLPGLMPQMSPVEALETSMIRSLCGAVDAGGLSLDRPFCDPHHTASSAAIIGGGRRALPGQISLAHNGVLFLDELPEFSRHVLDTLRQPVETGEVTVARANAHVRYPCRFLLVAAANPCRCGYLADPERACARAPICGQDYMAKVSGPLMDRFDLRIEVPAVRFADLDTAPTGAPSAQIAAKIAAARAIQAERYSAAPGVFVNADAHGDILTSAAQMDDDARTLLRRGAERFNLTARGYHRVIRVARTIADLADSPEIKRKHVAEALGYRIGYWASD